MLVGKDRRGQAKAMHGVWLAAALASPFSAAAPGPLESVWAWLASSTVLTVPPACSTGFRPGAARSGPRLPASVLSGRAHPHQRQDHAARLPLPHPASVSAARACRSPAMPRRPSREPASGLVKPALFSQEQRLFQLARRRGLQRLKAAAFKLPVRRIAGSFAGNNTPPDSPAWMLHLEPGKISGRGAAHGIDSTTQMPRACITGTPPTMAGPGTCGVLIRAAARQCQLPCRSPIWTSAQVTTVSLEPAGGGLPLPAFRENIVPVVPGCTAAGGPRSAIRPALAGFQQARLPPPLPAATGQPPQPLIPARDALTGRRRAPARGMSLL